MLAVFESEILGGGDDAEEQRGERGGERQENHHGEAAPKHLGVARGVDALDGLRIHRAAQADEENPTEPFQLAGGIGRRFDFSLGGGNRLRRGGGVGLEGVRLLHQLRGGLGGGVVFVDDEAEHEEEAEDEDDALNGVGPRNGAEAAKVFVNNHDDGEQDDAGDE